MTGQTSDSHPGHSTQGQTGEQVAVFAVPIGGGSEIEIVAETDDVSESSDNPPPVPFSGFVNLGSGAYTIVLRHVGGGPINSVCVAVDVTFRPPPTTTTTTTTTTAPPRPAHTTSTTVPTPGLFSFSAVVATCPEGVPTITITFPTRRSSTARLATSSSLIPSTRLLMCSS